MKSITLSSCQKDKYDPAVVRAKAKVLARSDIVAPIEVMLEMGHLTRNK